MPRWSVAFALAACISPSVAAQDAPGVVVEEVVANSIAARAGIAVGDRVVSYNARPVTSPATLSALEENTVTAGSIVVVVQRGDDTMTLTVPRGSLGTRVRPALSGDRTGAAWLQWRVGETHEGALRWKEACAAYNSAWAQLENGGDAAAQSQTLTALGRCSERLEDLAAAERWYRQAEQTSRAAGLELWEAAAVGSLGNVAFTRGQLARAREEQLRALQIRERVAPGSLEVAGSYYSLARIDWMRGDLKSAQAYATHSLDLRQQLAPESPLTADTLSMLGILQSARGDLAAATDYFTRALTLRERAGPAGLDLAAIINNLGDVARLGGDLDASHAYHLRAMAMREMLAPAGLEVAHSLNNLGNVARQRGDLAAAEDFQRKALEIRVRVAPGSLDVAFSLNNLGNVLKDRGDLDGAEDYHQRSLVIKERLSPNSLDVASSLFNLGIVAEARRDLAAAEQYHRRAFVLREQLAPASLLVSQSLNSLGSIARDRGDLTSGHAHLSAALAIREKFAPDSLDVARTLDNLGVLSRMKGDSPQAQQLVTRSISIRERRAPKSLEVAKSLNLLGNIALDEHRSTDALPLFTRAVDIVEARRWETPSLEARALLLEQNSDAYAGLLRTQLARGDLAAAFAAAERGRARSLLESLSEARAEIRQGVEARLLERESALQRQINAKASRQTQLLGGRHTPEEAARLAEELDALLKQFRELQAEIRTTSPRYAALTQPQPLSLSDIQRTILDEGTLLLEYVLGESGSHLFAVTSTAIEHFSLPARAEIERAVRRLSTALVARQPIAGETAALRRARVAKADADYPTAAADLTRIVLAPIGARLSGQRLLIVADGALQYVPFAALPQPGQAATPTAAPLIVGHEIVYLPSASIVAVLRSERGARPRAERAAAVLADPVFDAADSRLKRHDDADPAIPLPANVTRIARAAGAADARGVFGRLPFSRDEADAIVALAPTGATRAVDFRANREMLTMPAVSRARVVHLATHGLLDDERPDLSGLVLSLFDEQGRPQDGFLRLHEIYNLDWSADLVVLSACQTALGRDIRGEGLIGLTRGFMYSGAAGVVASLWNINDSATAQFMTRFYEGLFAKKLTPAAALRSAQVAMWQRRGSAAPYYWAAFVLQGEWR